MAPWHKLLRAALALSVCAGLLGCASQQTETREERGRNATSACRGNGGVTAFDDDSVICADQTFTDQRGAKAVEACRRRGGAAAFDDDLVICRDGTFHAVEGG